jgi:hypothetical protein
VVGVLVSVAMMLLYRVGESSHVLSFRFVLVFSILCHLSQLRSVLDVKNPRVAIDFGQNLTRRLTDSPAGNKEDIINDLTDYYILLNTAYRVEDKSFPKGKQTLQELKAKGGPPFTDLKVKEDLLRRQYNMGEVEIDHVKEVIEDINRLWKEIKMELV